MANASRVAEIFQQASVAFGRLAQLTIDLKLAQCQQIDDEQKENSKWTSTEICQLKEAVARFGNDLGKIAESIETKTLAQVKQKVKSKAFQDAGLSESTTTETEQTSEGLTTSNEMAVASNMSVVEKSRRKQSLDEVSEHDTPSTKRTRLNEFLDIGSSADMKQEKVHDERPSAPEHLAPTEVKDDGALFKRQPRPNSAALGLSSGSGLLSNSKLTAEILSKPSIGRSVTILTKPTIRFNPNPTVSELKYEEYEDSGDGDDADEYEDYDEDEEDTGQDDSNRHEDLEDEEQD